MPSSKPTSLSIHVYNVGFGDCFLLSFHYGADKSKDRHVMIDFGSVGLPFKLSAPKAYGRIAEDIRTTTGGKLHGVVLTHRHKDHIDGFTPKGPKSSGEIIRSLNPDVVVQPWTEDPHAKANFPGPGDHNLAFAENLESMRVLSEGIVKEATHLLDTDPHPDQQRSLFSGLKFLALEGVKNEAAVKNLEKMGKKHRYVFAGSDSGLEDVLPGVKVTVVGPPTISQYEKVKGERTEDENEFWMLQGLTGKHLLGDARDLFPRATRENLRHTPGYARWIIPRLRRLRAENLLQIVRIMDDYMNNTSVVLLFEINGTALLFPGDAQIENWEYSLSDAKLMKRIAKASVYKVGHHGSRNATPRTLWNMFTHKGPAGQAGRLRTIMSTKRLKRWSNTAGHGEVPRTTLVTALKANSDLFTTQDLKQNEMKKVIEVAF